MFPFCRVYQFAFQTVLGLLVGDGLRLRLRLRLVPSQGSPYPSRSPRAHPSGWTRTQGLSRMDSAC